jgi:hypothetical protein
MAVPGLVWHCCPNTSINRSEFIMIKPTMIDRVLPSAAITISLYFILMALKMEPLTAVVLLSQASLWFLYTLVLDKDPNQSGKIQQFRDRNFYSAVLATMALTAILVLLLRN